MNGKRDRDPTATLGKATVLAQIAALVDRAQTPQLRREAHHEAIR
jgi:hypothetical protein